MSGIYRYCGMCGNKTWHRPLDDGKCEICHPEVRDL